MPQSITTIGSFTASGIAPSAGGGVHSPSRSSSSRRRATIGGQWCGPSGGPPVDQVSDSSSSASVASWRDSWKMSSPSSRKPCVASSAPNSRTLLKKRDWNQ